MKSFPLPNRAVAAPLIGLILVWSLTMASNYVGYFENGASGWHASQWLMLAGLLVGGFSSLIGRGLAVRAIDTSPSALARAAERFANLTLVISLGALVIFAFAIFMGGFNEYSRTGSVLERFTWLYLPILIAAGAVVFLILRAFVFGQGQSREADQPKARMTERQKALALGYAVPILCSAFAVILGLFIYDATRTTLQTWVWVVIISIVGFGVIAGTRFAAKARSTRAEAPRPRNAGAAGAATLNFVLSIVFGAVVSILAFTLGAAAISKLTFSVIPMQTDSYSSSETFYSSIAINNPAVTVGWFLNDFLPAIVLIVLAAWGIYLSITERNRERGEQPEAN